MNLKKIQEAFKAYKTYLKSPKRDERLYLWESQKIFQANWSLEERDLQEMYDESLQNTTTRRMWNRQAYEPKRMMLLFWEAAPDFVTQMFKELYNEDKPIDIRVSRFAFYCDQLLEDYRENHPGTIENSHYHNDDYQIISLYLALRYPASYAYYSFSAFTSALKQFGVVNIPRVNDFERFVKVSRTIFKLMQKEEDLLELHTKRIKPEKHYSDESLMIVTDFLLWLESQ